MEQYMQISYIGIHLYFLVNTSCMYIMYVLNVPMCIYEFILPFLLFI